MYIAPKITLDTNCIINLFDSSAIHPTSVQALNDLFRLGLSNKADIAITTRVESDLSRDPEPERKADMLKKLNMFPVVGSTFRLDTSRLDSKDMLGNVSTSELADEIQKIVFPGLSKDDRRYANKITDIDQLGGHILNKRDFFVTDDNDFLKKRETLRSSLSVIVMSPAECVEYIEDLQNRSAPKTFSQEEINPLYHSSALSGKVTFDYSNNNHRYAIGEGHFLFETRWSSASQIAIYAYTDAPSIDCLALAKGHEKISGMGDVSVYDFSSRVRAPNIGQIVIWRNKNGIYAATKIIDIKVDSRGDTHDELTFEYMIQPNGTSIF